MKEYFTILGNKLLLLSDKMRRPLSCLSVKDEGHASMWWRVPSITTGKSGETASLAQMSDWMFPIWEYISRIDLLIYIPKCQRNILSIQNDLFSEEHAIACCVFK